MFKNRYSTLNWPLLKELHFLDVISSIDVVINDKSSPPPIHFLDLVCMIHAKTIEIDSPQNVAFSGPNMFNRCSNK